jgi:8-oxo-dGTP pyrophosphatase MutT (NUDIX family)
LTEPSQNNYSIWRSPDFETELEKILRCRQKKRLPDAGLTIAAVLVPLLYINGRPHILLTQRSEHVEHHKGEISFPGGKFDSGDKDFIDCALRETSEEIGVRPSDVRLIGELDDFYTVATKYLVVPFVGAIPHPYEFRPSVREISAVISVPLRVFFDPDYRREYIWDHNGEPIEMVSYLWEGHNIWGATARILKHFVELVESWEPGLCDKI